MLLTAVSWAALQLGAAEVTLTLLLCFYFRFTFADNVLFDPSAGAGVHLLHPLPFCFTDHLLILCHILVHQGREVSFSTWLQVIFVV